MASRLSRRARLGLSCGGRALLGRDEGNAPVSPPALVAVIDETDCIGCTLCLPPCPVDAIVGAQGVMHTVLTKECTGCELCVPACPVDCITLVPAPASEASAPKRTARAPDRALERACIHCGECDTACPVALPAHDLLTLVRAENLEQAAASGLGECIECGLCDRVCPSDIAMATAFTGAKVQHAEQQAVAAEKMRLKDRNAAHEARRSARETAAQSKRTARLQGKRTWT